MRCRQTHIYLCKNTYCFARWSIEEVRLNGWRLCWENRGSWRACVRKSMSCCLGKWLGDLKRLLWFQGKLIFYVNALLCNFSVFFLTSEEAEAMWKKRQAEWEREQRARDRLMAEVLHGLQQQVIFGKNVIMVMHKRIFILPKS